MRCKPRFCASSCAHLDAWNAARRQIAAVYADCCRPRSDAPVERPDSHHVYHLYVVRVAERDAFRARLQAAGIGTGIHYPVPIHLQPAYAIPRGGRPASLPHTERAAGEILSLPMHPR